MCFNAKQQHISALKRAKYYGVEQDIVYFAQKILEEQQIEDHYQVSGFSHPKLITYTNEKPYEPKLLNWGLIPHWTKNIENAKRISNSTINARCETIFELPSFRDAAKNKRCIIPLDGFYEHHHFKGDKYPFFISRKDKEPLNVAGLWSEWINKETGEIIKTLSIVTTKANKMMAKIHNNPKLSEPRMPVILSDSQIDNWLNNNNPRDIEQLLIPFPETELTAHTVKKLSGKESPGNVPEASDEYIYEDLIKNF